MKRLFVTIALLAAASGIAPEARAVEGYEACTALITSLPVTLSTGGRYCLDRDLMTPLASGAAITVGANNVTIACSGFKIGNLLAGPASQAIGVQSNRLNTRVIGCHIRGFLGALSANPAHGAWVENNLFEATSGTAVYVSGA